MKRIQILLIGFFGLLWMPMDLKAQVKVQVVTKTVEKSFEFDQGNIVSLQGEKANIQVHVWDQKKVKVVLKLISKAIDRSVAEKELDKQKYILERVKNTVHIKNYFVVPKGKELQAILQSEYELWLPREAMLEVNNRYGDITLLGGLDTCKIDIQYGTLNAELMGGRSTINGYFGDLLVGKLTGDFRMDVKHFESSIKQITGKGYIQNVLSDLTIGDVGDTAQLSVEASKSDVVIESVSFDRHAFKLQTEYGQISLPAKYMDRVQTSEEELKTWEQGDKNDDLIQITGRFGNVKIKSK